MLIRDAMPGDYTAILELNQRSVAVLSPLDRQELEAIAASAHLFRVVEVSEESTGATRDTGSETAITPPASAEIAAFLIAFRQGAAYESPNFLWFDQRYEDFLYIDRVVVAAPYRGQGLGQRLYTDVVSQAQSAHMPQIALEVDIEPPNLPSLKFHQQQGFKEVGQLKPYGAKVVSLQVKSLHASDRATLFHIVEQTAWQTAQAAGNYQPASLETEGFIHLSSEEQVIGTANRFYRGQMGLVLLEIERDRLQSKLRYDTVPGHGTFPHLYGPLNLDAVTKVWHFNPNPDGIFTDWDQGI